LHEKYGGTAEQRLNDQDNRRSSGRSFADQVTSLANDDDPANEQEKAHPPGWVDALRSSAISLENISSSA
jgi:hypothetical protein